jgi:hypothetical protein
MALKKGSGVKVTKLKDPGAIMKALGRMAENEVLVGFPEASTQRKEEPEEEAQGLTNAALGYIHDNGAPEANIPARPFMVPGIQKATKRIVAIAKKTAAKALEPGEDAQGTIDQGLHAMGLVATASIKGVINSGIDPPLADSTLRARAARGRKGAKKELERRAKGLPAGKALAKPLVDTAQMRNAVNYVVRNRKKRSA